MTTQSVYDVRFQLAASSVDSKSGVIRSATVAKSGVTAVGKYVFLDANDQLTTNEDQAKRRVPVTTDSKTLDTLMSAAKAAGGRVKIRSDHDDSIASRAGYADNFKPADGLIACDLNLFDSYEDRAIVLEAANKTPDQIGLSIDFRPSFEIIGDSAVMRVEELYAVDIVDAGAITPAGLFLSARVDSINNQEAINKLTMAETKDTPDKIDQCLSAINKLVDSHAALTAGHAALSAQVQEMSKAKATDKADGGDEAMKASLAEISAKLAAQNEVILDMKKNSAALGLKAGSEAAAVAAKSAADEATQAKEKDKGFSDLVKEAKADGKMSASEANRFVMRKHPELYAAHLKTLGIAGK